MNRTIRLLALAIAIFGFAPAVQAAQAGDEGLDDYRVTHWERTGGSATELVFALAQDREGYLWLGSGDGLTRFDGFTFERWDDISRARLAGTSVRVLFVDLDGALWVGFDEGGVSRISGGPRPEVVNYGSAQGLNTFSVRTLTQDSVGTMWAGSLDGLFRLQDGRWHRAPEGQGLPVSPVLSAMSDTTGSLFVGTPDGIFRRRAGSSSFESLAAQAIGASSVQVLCKDSHGHVVASDPIRGLRILDADADHPLPATSGIGLRIVCSRNGTIWVGTRLTGLWRVEPSEPGHAPVVHAGLLGQAALAVLEDRDQNVWVGTNTGLYRLTPRNVRTLRGADGPTAVALDRTGRLLVGTITGLAEFRRAGDEWIRAATYLPGAQIRSVHADANDTLWVATTNGVTRLARDGSSAAPAWGHPLRQVTSITSSGDGTVWFYDERLGLSRWRGQQLEPVEIADDLKGVQRTVLHADRRNRLWLVGDRGVEIRGQDGDIRRYGPGDGLADASYRSIYEDSAGVIWLGGTAGLTRLLDGRLESVTIPGVRRTSWIKGIVEDRQGRLWLGIDRGGVRLSRASFQNALHTPTRTLADGFEVFDGLPGTIRALSDGVVVRTPDDQLWFTTDEGVALVDTQANLPDLGAVTARITSAVANDESVEPADMERLASGINRLRVSWAALDLTTPERVRFRYRLDGLDREWRDAGTTREVEYANLPPGAYVLRVVAAREGDAWTDANASAWEFSVAPRFYQTVWFPFLAAALVASASWATWHLRLVQARRRFAIMLAERTRVSREVHDTLLQSLVGVALQCQALADGKDTTTMRDRLVQLRRRIDEHIEEGRELIWNLRSPTLEKYDLVAALRHMADDIVEGSAVRVEFTTTGKVRSCSPRVERELLRIGQEAITNAVRHGQPTLVRIELQFEETSLRLRVTDDGAGFDPSGTLATADRHCGLLMMRERAEDIDGRCSISSTPGRGTCVDATAPLPAASA